MKTKNKMGSTPVRSLMLKMGLPMILSMVFQAFYNIVDSYFVSNMHDTELITGVGEYGVNALTLAFPVQMLMIAVGVGTGVGINALLAKSLGENNREKAGKIAGNAIFLGICTYAVFLIIGLFGIDAYLRTQITDAVILEMGSEYLRICTVLSFGAILYMIYEKLLQSTGRTMLSTIAQMAGAVTNIILDPIMIFGLFGFPQMGIAGAAYATVIGQIISFILGIIFHHKLNKDVSTDFKYLKPDIKIIAKIYKIGIPAIIMQALMSVMTYGVNIIFNGISGSMVTAYGVYYKVQQFVFFAVFGMNNAIIPIVAFNYGMRDEKRVKDGIKYGMIYTLVIMFAGIVLLQSFAGQIASSFALSESTTDLCITALHVVTLGYLFAGVNIACQGIFQAFGNGVRSLVISVIRLILVPLPLTYILTLLPNAENMIWWSFPAAEFLACIGAFILLKQTLKEKIPFLKADHEYNMTDERLQSENLV